jgi:hypothetical protein
MPAVPPVGPYWAGASPSLEFSDHAGVSLTRDKGFGSHLGLRIWNFAARKPLNLLGLQIVQGEAQAEVAEGVTADAGSISKPATRVSTPRRRLVGTRDALAGTVESLQPELSH